MKIKFKFDLLSNKISFLMLTSMLLHSIRRWIISIFPLEAAKCNTVALIYLKTSRNTIQNFILINIFFIYKYFYCIKLMEIYQENEKNESFKYDACEVEILKEEPTDGLTDGLQLSF